MPKKLQDWLDTDVRPFRDKPLTWLSQYHFFRDPIRPTVLPAPDRGPGHRPHHPLRAETESTRRPGSTLLTGPLWLAGRPHPSVVVRVRLRDGSGDGRPRGGGDRPDHQARGRSDVIVEATITGDDAMNQVGIQMPQVTR